MKIERQQRVCGNKKKKREEWTVSERSCTEVVQKLDRVSQRTKEAESFICLHTHTYTLSYIYI